MNPTYAVNCSTLFTDLPLLDRPRAAREAGFEAVEFEWPFDEATPSDPDVDRFVEAVQDAGVVLSGLDFVAGNMASGDRGILSDPALTTAFRDNVQVAIGIGEALGTRAFNALYGNRVDGLAAAVQDEVAAVNLAYAARAAHRIGAVVLIEPVSGVSRYPLKFAADAVHVIDWVRQQSGTTNLRLLADLYHLYVNGDDIASTIAEYSEDIGHVQIADAPERGEPGSGEIPFAEYFWLLRAHGYTGYVGLEYEASRTDSFDWLPRAERGRSGVDLQSL